MTAAEIEDPPDADTDPGSSGMGCAVSPIAVGRDGPSAALFAYGVLGALVYERRRPPSR
ncbi:MAG: hypothetical protein WBN10_16185 [Polyangiales bacterium]